MNQQANAKRSFPYVGLILWVTLALVVLILGYTFVDSLGIIGRLDNAAKSDNIKLNEKELDIYRYHVAQNQLYTEFMYYQYGLMQDTQGITKLFSNGYEYANYMLPNYVGSEAFDAQAYQYAEQYLTYCEGAMEAGLYDSYKDEVTEDIENYIEDLKATAEANRVSFSKYLDQWIGNGVSKSDVESAMEYYYIGIKYAEKLQEDYSTAATDDDIVKYRDDNKATFYSTKYTSYKLVDNKLKDIAKDCKTADDIKTAIVDYYMDLKFDTHYKTHFTDKKVEDTAGKDQTKADVKTTILALNEIGDAKAVFKSDDTDAYKKAAYTVASLVNTSAKTEIAKVKESSAKYADPTASSATDLQKWLFGEGRTEGHYNVIETKTTSKDSTTGKDKTTYSYTWYVVEEAMILDTELTKNAYYIMLSDDGKDVENPLTAAQKAEAFYKALSEDKTPEKFAELVEKYAPGYSAELNERISHESLKAQSEDLADWLYEEDRAEKDIVNIPVKGDTKDPEKVTGHIIAMYIDENEETWKLTARDSIAGEKLQAWFDEAVKKYNVVIDFEPETTATTTAKDEGTKEPTTSAGTEAATEATTEAATEATTEAATEATTEAE